MKQLKPLRLSGVMTFALVAIAVIALNLWWRDRSNLAREVEWLKQQITHPEKYLAV